MALLEVTEAEKRVIEFLRSARPFEHIDIMMDKSGKPDNFFIHRSQKIIVRGISASLALIQETA